MSTVPRPGVILTFTHHHPALIVIGCTAAGIYGAGYEIKLLADRKIRSGSEIKVKEVLGALCMLPAAAVAAGVLLDSRLTFRLLEAGAGLTVICGGTLLICTRKMRRHRRLHYRPVHRAIGNAAGHSDSTPARDYLNIKRDLSQVKVRMTPDAASVQGKVQHLKKSVPQILQLGECKIDEYLHGPHPRLVFTPVPPPKPMPGKLALADILPRLTEADGPKQIAQGIAGDREMITADFSRVVHELISARTSSGKSNKTTFTLMQFLHKGAVGIVIDPTGMSYPWAKDLPSVFYARNDGDVRRACYWLDGEIRRRDEFVRDHSDISGYVEGGFGPDLIVVADEKNLMERRLSADWQADGNKGRDPALAILDDVHFAGRKIGIHAIVPMVRGDAKAAGGGTVRGQAGLITFGANPHQTEWDMFFRGDKKPECKEIPPPPGRMQTCFGNEVREIQVPHCLEVPGQNATQAERNRAMEIAQTVKDYALSGTVTPVPDELTDSEEEYDDPNTDLEERPPPTHHEDAQVTLAEAAGNLVALTLTQLRNASRGDGFPAQAGKRGAAGLYQRADIIAWERDRIARGAAPAGISNVIQGRFPREENK